jgi:adenine-specific DNA-methyltransferase
VADKDVSELARESLVKSRKQQDIVFKSERDGLSDIYFLNGEQLIFYSAKTKYIDGERVTAQALSTIWDDLLSNNLHKEGGVRFPNGKKPEKLLKRIIELTTDEGDLVLDSFAGSGTTAAVAHKLNRKWITIEMREHCHTHIVPRLIKVISGSDQDGISKAVNWRGGGGFRYYKLAPSMILEDSWGHPVINPEYNAAMLAEAMCKHMGYTYAPSETQFWNHGYSTESDFIYVTTQALSYEQLKVIHDELGPDGTLTICCKAYRKALKTLPNLTIHKIPQAVLDRCEWGRDDYSLDVAALHAQPVEEDDVHGSTSVAGAGCAGATEQGEEHDA